MTSMSATPGGPSDEQRAEHPDGYGIDGRDSIGLTGAWPEPTDGAAAQATDVGADLRDEACVWDAAVDEPGVVTPGQAAWLEDADEVEL